MATNIGDAKDNVIVGKDFVDQLFGRGGDDLLVGGSGGDFLNGGEGDDILAGGEGNDVFVFGISDKGGLREVYKDKIWDFTVGEDKLKIEKGMNGFNNAKDVLSKASDTKAGLKIDLGFGDSIILKGVKKADIEGNPGEHINVGKFDA